MSLYTKHLPEKKAEGEDFSPTLAGGVNPTDLTDQEKELVEKDVLGYCENHKILFKKWALPHCPIPSIFRNMGECKEWPMDPNYSEIHHE